MGKIQIRQGVFETNSSSTHSITISQKSDYLKWLNNELYFIKEKERFCTIEEGDRMNKELGEDCDIVDKIYDGAVTYDEYIEWLNDNYFAETFTKDYKTPNGEDIIAFGYYGMD